MTITAWKVSKYGVISGLYFPVFSPNTGIYGPKITSHLDTFHAVDVIIFWSYYSGFGRHVYNSAEHLPFFEATIRTVKKDVTGAIGY